MWFLRHRHNVIETAVDCYLMLCALREGQWDENKLLVGVLWFLACASRSQLTAVQCCVGNRVLCCCLFSWHFCLILWEKYV
jgi:hypothetical protein